VGLQYTGYRRWTYPVVRDVALTGQAHGTYSGSISIAAPLNTQRGDVMLLFLSTNKDTTTQPGGWAQKQNGVSATLAHQSFLYAKVATAADEGGASYTWTVAGTTAAPVCAIVYAIGGVNSTITTSIGTEDTGVGPFTSPSVLTPGGPSLRIHFAASRTASTTPLVLNWSTGRTKFEVTNPGTSVSYTASSAQENGITYGGSGGGQSNSVTSGTNTTIFEYQVAMMSSGANDGQWPYQPNSLRRSSTW
jgi:hypothetical protein